MKSEMSNPPGRSHRAGAYLWAAALASLIGFSLVYVSLRLSGNGSYEINRAKTVKSVPDSAKMPGTEAVKTVSEAKGGVLAGLNRGAMAGFLVRPTPLDLPEISFISEAGESLTMKDWRGKVVLLNLWATWCAPCRKEMPDLDQLKADLGGDNFDVVAINIDRGNLEKPRKFMDEIKLKHLALYGNNSGRLAPKLRAVGLPTTIIISRTGKELGRLFGPAEWASDEAKALILAAIGNNS